MAPPRLFPSKGLTPKAAPAAPKSLIATLPAEQKALFLPQSDFWLDGNPERSDRAPDADAITRTRAFGASSLVFACMSFRARKISEAPLWIREETDGDEAWLKGDAGHPLAELLEQPNPDQSAADFLAELSFAMDVGDVLVVKNRDRAGRAGELTVCSYLDFRVRPTNENGRRRRYGAFTVFDADGRERPVAREDVIYFPTLGGVSPVAAALSHVRVSEAMRQAIRASLAKSMRPGSVTTLDGGLQDDQFQRFKSQLMAWHAGGHNTGNNIVLDGPGIKFQKLDASLKDLELGPVQADVEVAVCQAFALRPEVVGAKIALEHNGGLADSLKPAIQFAYNEAIRPTWKRIETAFTAGLLREVDDNPVRFVRFVTSDVEALQPDLTADVNVAKAATGIATLDEQRAIMHLAPVGPERGGDDIAPAAGTGQAPSDGTTRAQEAAAKASRPTLATKAARLATDADRAAYWQAFEAKAAPRVGAYERAARRRFREERAGVLAVLRSAVPKAAAVALERKDDTGGVIDPAVEATFRQASEDPYLEAALLSILSDYAETGPYAAAWTEEFTALLRVTMTEAAADFSAGFGLAFSMDNPAVLAAIEERAAQLVQNVLQTTKKAITDAITSGRAEGLTVAQIADRVNTQAFGAAAEARARTIANTEVVGAINQAEWVAAQQAGVFRSKRWIHSRNANERKHHKAHETEGPDGGWVPMAHAYAYPAQGTKAGGTSLRPHEPGMPAREAVECGCTMAYSDVDPAQARQENA
jgi:HK97 family phage portal protein